MQKQMKIVSVHKQSIIKHQLTFRFHFDSDGSKIRRACIQACRICNSYYNMSLQIKLKYCLLLIVLIGGVLADDGEDHEDCNRCDMSNEGCNICYSNCTTLIFIGCENNMGPLSQPACIQKCCSEDSSSTVFEQQYLNRCLDNTKNSDEVRSTAYYAILAAGSVAVFILIILIIRAIYRRFQISRQHNVRAQSRFVSFQFSREQGSFNNFRHDEIVNPKTYPANCKDIIDDSTNSCCICLDGNVNSITKCGHVFHLNCLASWASRKNTCPLCNYADIHQAKLFCKTCKMEVEDINFRKVRTSAVQALNSKQCSVCSK